ncbi:zinc ribbon domain-containing protein [Shewanella marina]|uniref:zinc ribbon domain-containing protein n=1 Tax=Shewanella marina TaxID=487319 RepID=UPI00046FB760|nr:zinc ribbon domain-containing protein [Shewanella marina]
MHHCGNEVYVQDKFCTQCGDELNDCVQIKQIIDLEPDLFAELPESCVDPKLFTGRLKNSYYYKRHNKNGNNSVTYAYWWITLENALGEIKQISINAENSAFNNMKVGDVITIFEAMPVNLSFKIDSAAKERVTNNLMGSGVILHKDDKQTSTLTNHFDSSKPSLIGMIIIGFILAFLAAGLIQMNSNLTEDTIIVLGIMCSCMCMIPWYNYSRSNHQAAIIRKQRIEAVIAKILNISKYQLGYHKFERPALNDDIFCHHCEQRIHADVDFCQHCGTSTHIVALPEVVASNDERVEQTQIACDGNTAIAIEPIVMPQQQPKKTIREMRLAKMKEFYVSEEQEFTFKRTLIKNDQFKGSVWCYMVQVTDRDFNTQVSDVTHTETYRTDYTNRNGSVVDSKYETVSYRVRDSKLSGKITVEDELGEIFEQWLPETLLKQTDVGDYLLIGYSRIGNKKYSRLTYGEYYYNITKGRWEMPQSILNYGETSFIVKCIVGLVAAACAALAYYTQQYAVAAGIFATFIALLGIKSHLADSANSKAGHLFIKPIMDTLYRVRDNKQELLTYLAKLK